MNGIVEAAVDAMQQSRTVIAIVIPVTGGLLAVAAEGWGPRGKAKGLVTGAYMLMACFGGSCLLFALIAALEGATRRQIEPLLMVGIILTVIMGGFTPHVIRMYQHFEGRRLAARLFLRS